MSKSDKKGGDLLLKGQIYHNGTVTIPRAIRHALGLELGGPVYFTVPRNQKKAERDYAAQRRGK